MKHCRKRAPASKPMAHRRKYSSYENATKGISHYSDCHAQKYDRRANVLRIPILYSGQECWNRLNDTVSGGYSCCENRILTGTSLPLPEAAGDTCTREERQRQSLTVTACLLPGQSLALPALRSLIECIAVIQSLSRKGRRSHSCRVRHRSPRAVVT